jgi:hypothetical protein
MKLESKPAANLVLYLIAITVGLVLMWLARDFSHAGSNVRAGFLLGCLLFGVGALALLVGEARSVELDEVRRVIVLEVRRRVGGNRRIEIPFSKISGCSIGMQGSRSEGSRYYDLVVRLKSGKEIYLFGGCVFEGRLSREWIEELRSRFDRAILRPD